MTHMLHLPWVWVCRKSLHAVPEPQGFPTSHFPQYSSGSHCLHWECSPPGLSQIPLRALQGFAPWLGPSHRLCSPSHSPPARSTAPCAISQLTPKAASPVPAAPSATSWGCRGHGGVGGRWGFWHSPHIEVHNPKGRAGSAHTTPNPDPEDAHRGRLFSLAALVVVSTVITITIYIYYIYTS